MATQEHATHAEHEERYDRHTINRMGLLTFLAGEATLVLALLMLRFMLAGATRPPGGNIVSGLVMTVLILLGMVTARRALAGAKEGDTQALGRNLLLTMFLGTAFLVVAAVEWALTFGALPLSDVFGSVFYLMAGLDHLHIFIGILLLWVAYINRRKFGPQDYWGVEGPVWFWYFSSGFWIAVFVFLYLV